MGNKIVHSAPASGQAVRSDRAVRHTTPGPWAVEQIGVSDAGPNGVDVFDIGPTVPADIGDLGVQRVMVKRVATVAGDDAYLIAAAPDGYKLAEAVVRWYENSGNEDPTQSSIGSVELWRQAKAFINKTAGLVSPQDNIEAKS